MSITLWQCYQNIAARISQNALSGLTSCEDWEAGRAGLRREFFASMGLDPMPGKDGLRTADWGEFSGPGYKARKVAYELAPDCWGTGTAFIPDPAPAGRAPAVLYACGHKPIGIHGYQDHAIMWARRGYVCFIFDTIEQHDNPGEHHGLYHASRFDWVSTGYSGAGGELWNTIRALDVLAGLPDVDPERIGATGNSGGGALSFYIGVADERVKAVATSCGMTTPDLTIARRNMMGHCDCIYNHNPYQRDTAEFAALMAPRPLLFCYAIHDGLFNVPEYKAIAERTRRVYQLYGCPEKCALFDYPGPHGYQPESIQAINAWLDEHVAGEEMPALERGPVETEERVATVFNGLSPAPNRLELLPDLLTVRGGVRLPQDAGEWPAIREEAVRGLREKVLHAALRRPEASEPELIGDWRSGPDPANRRMEYRAEIEGVEVWWTLHNRCDRTDVAVVTVASPEQTERQAVHAAAGFAPEHALVALEPRGAGFSHCSTQETHLLRAGALVGLTPAMLMIQDLEAMMGFVREHPFAKGKRIVLHGKGEAAVACLYHAVLHEDIAGVVLEDLPPSHRKGGYILGILKRMDIPEALGLLAPRPAAASLGLRTNKHWPRRAYERVGAEGKLLVGASAHRGFEHVLGALG